MNNPKGKRAIIYRRVSTSEQKNYGNSLSNQKERLDDFCRSNSIEIIKDFEEDYSGKNFERPVFSKLYEYANSNKNQIDYLLVYKWDRFSRNTLDALNMVEKFKGFNIEVNSIEQWMNHNDPNQLLLYLINLGIPEVDNRIRQNRTREGIRSNQISGRWVSSQPKGYIPGKDEFGKVLMKPDPKISSLISELFNDFSLDIYSQNQLIKLPKYKPLELNKNSLSRILNQIAYSGRIKVKEYKNQPEQIVDALHIPLVSVEIFEKCQKVLYKRRRVINKPAKVNINLPLRGYLECSKCGSNLTGSGSKSKTGKIHYYYHCNPRNGCNERIKAPLMHSEIELEFDKLKPNKKVLNLFKLILKEKFENSEKSKKKLIKNIDEKINHLSKRKSNLLDKYLDGLLDNNTYNSKNKEIISSITQLKTDKLKLKDFEKDTDEFISFCIYLINNLGGLFKTSNIQIKQKLLSSILKEKLVFKGEKYRTLKLNKGIELIVLNINKLEQLKKQNGKLSFDNIPLST